MTSGITLSESTNTERAILGAAMLGNFAEASQLKPEDFPHDSYRRVFKAMQKLASENAPIDLLTVTDCLSRSKELESVGGAGVVAEMLDFCPDTPRVAHYCKMLREQSARESLIRAADLVISRAAAGESLADLQTVMLDAALDVESRTGSGFVSPRDFMPEVLRELEREANAGGLVGLPTGVSTLDETTGGLRAGELIVIGALPGAGKTALACQIVTANAEADNPVGVFSVEMSKWDLGRRFLASGTSLGANRIRHPRLIQREQWKELAECDAGVSAWPVAIDDSGSLRIEQLLAQSRLLIQRKKVKLIIVDYLQLIQAEARDIRERVGKVADALRQLAKSERIPVVLLSQLRRPANVNDPPTMIDLKESGDIEAHAHMVLLLHCPLANDGAPSGDDQIIIGKNRNGMRGSLPVFFHKQSLRFVTRESIPS
jgi:replicative DNA helicase